MISPLDRSSSFTKGRHGKNLRSENYGHIIFFMKQKLINLILSCIETTASYVMYMRGGSEKEEKIVHDYWTLTYRKSYSNCSTPLDLTRLSFYFWKSIRSAERRRYGVRARASIYLCLYNQSGYTQNKENRVTHDTVAAFICGIGGMHNTGAPCVIKHATSESIFNFIPIH